VYQRILVPIDGSEVSNAAVEEAAKLAKELRARLCLVHVVDLSGLYRTVGSGVPIGDIEQLVLQGGQQELNQAEGIAAREGIIPETTLIRSASGRISTAIIDQAKRWAADLIVMGTHGRGGLERLFLGSVAEGVARAATVPVLLVRGSDEAR
jgi:nucleotide-binding universal stress UspA family protein